MLICCIVLKAGPLLSSLTMVRKIYYLPGGSVVIWLVKKLYAQFVLGYALISFCLFTFERYGAVIIQELFLVVINLCMISIKTVIVSVCRRARSALKQSYQNRI